SVPRSMQACPTRRSSDLLRVRDVVALDGLDVERGGQVAHDRVEQGLHALVLERGAAEHGGDGGAAALAGRDGDPTDGRVELHHRDRKSTRLNSSHVKISN